MKNKPKFNTPELSVEELTKALYEANLQLQASNQKIIEEENRRKEFYANISHDLRAPITAISNSLQYILSGDNSLSQESVIETLQIIQRRTCFLEKLINDIFLLSSLESSSVKVHKEEVDLRFFIEDYFYMCEDDEKYTDCKLTLNMADDFDAKVMIDPILMQRAFDNLFANSLKYSDKAPEITLSAEIVDNNIEISIQDNGIGIDSKHIEHIFERSYQINRARTPDASNGSGFGLSIVKSIIVHHNGFIRCSSSLGEGTRFTISLPIL